MFYLGLEKSHGQRSLVDYSPQGHKESGTTEWLKNNKPWLDDIEFCSDVELLLDRFC